MLLNGCHGCDQRLDLLPLRAYQNGLNRHLWTFDDGDGAKRVVTALVEILAQKGDRTIWFGAPGAVLPDDTIEYGAPEVLREPFLRRVRNEPFIEVWKYSNFGESSQCPQMTKMDLSSKQFLFFDPILC